MHSILVISEIASSISVALLFKLVDFSILCDLKIVQSSHLDGNMLMGNNLRSGVRLSLLLFLTSVKAEGHNDVAELFNSSLSESLLVLKLAHSANESNILAWNSSLLRNSLFEFIDGLLGVDVHSKGSTCDSSNEDLHL